MLQTSTSRPTLGVGFHILRIVLASVLLTAAGFKAFALWTDPTPALSLFTSPRWQISLIEAETLLGLWLLSGIAPRGAWFMASITFVLMACISSYLGLTGQPSCGCLGKVELAPWYSFSLDVVAVAALWFLRPGDFSARALRDDWLLRLFRREFYLASGAGLIFVGTVAALFMAFPSLSEGLTFLRGESLTIEPSVVEVGNGEAGELRDFSLTIHNHTSRPISLVGGQAACGCITTEELPLDVPAGESRTIACKFHFRRTVGKFHYPYTLYTNDGSYSVVVARVAGRLVESTAP